MHEGELIKIIAYICNSGCLFNGWPGGVMRGWWVAGGWAVAGRLLYWRVLLRFIAPSAPTAPFHFITAPFLLPLLQMKAFWTYFTTQQRNLE